MGYFSEHRRVLTATKLGVVYVSTGSSAWTVYRARHSLAALDLFSYGSIGLG